MASNYSIIHILIEYETTKLSQNSAQTSILLLLCSANNTSKPELNEFKRKNCIEVIDSREKRY